MSLHVEPFLCCWVLRYYHKEISGANPISTFLKLKPLKYEIFEPHQVGWREMWLIPLAVYLAQNVLSWFFVNFIVPIPNDPKYLNLYRHVASQKWFRKIVDFVWTRSDNSGVPNRSTQFYFLMGEAIIGLVPMLLAKTFYKHELAMIAAGCLAMTIVVWNGANFYFEVFARRYYNKGKRE